MDVKNKGSTAIPLNNKVNQCGSTIPVVSTNKLVRMKYPTGAMKRELLFEETIGRLGICGKVENCREKGWGE